MRFLNFGSLNMDHVYRVDSFVGPGETKAARDFSVYAGGKGLNQSLALAKAGVEVWHAGKIGAEGGFLVQELESGGVNASLVERSGTATGHAIIQVDDEGRNSILLYGGANRDIDDAYIERVISGFGEGDFLLLQNEIGAIPRILEAAAGRGMRAAMNPAPLGPEVASYPLELVELLILNEVEALGLSGRPDPREASEKLLSRYPGARLVITLGAEGALYADASRVLRIPSYSVRAVDTTAAGDTFTGYFLAAWTEGKTIDEALELASRAAAICVTRPGAAASVPSRAEVESARLEARGP